MPRLQDIERFKRDLAALSREAEVLARWGESPEDVQAPPQSAAAPASPSAKGGPAAPKPRAAAPDEGLPPDFAALLDSLPLEKSDESASMGAELEALLAPSGPEESAAGAEESESLDDFLGSLAGLEAPDKVEEQGGGLDDLESLLAPEPVFPPAKSAPPTKVAPPAAAVEAFEIPGLEEPASIEALGAPEATFNIPGLEEAAPLETAAAPEEDFEIPGLEEATPIESAGVPEEAFEIPGLEEAAPIESAGVPEEAFEIPGLEETAQLESAAAPEEAFEIPGLEEAAPLESAAAPEEAFEIPGLEEAAPAESAEAPAAAEEFALPDLEQSFGGEGDLGAPSGGQSAAADEFAIPDFGFGEAPAGGAAAPEAAESLVGFEEAPGGAAAEAPAADAFESFSFEEPGGGGFGLPGAGTGLGADLDTELASLGEAGEAETFNLDREWGGFGEPGAEQAKAAPPPRAAPARPRAEEKYKAVSLSDAQVDHLQDALLSYPLNLRVAIEEALAYEKGSMAQRSKLVWAMVEGVAAEDAALLASRIVKRRIEIPKGFEKRTGAAFEAEKGSFLYILIHTVLPVLRMALLAVAVAGVLGWLGYRFVYTALAADASYRAGYRLIAQSRYPDAEAAFAKARGLKEYDSWYYRYAEAYVARRQYPLAERKYADLVARKPKETRAILDWARLEKDQLKFEEAVKVLKGVPRPGDPPATRGMSGLLSWDYFNKEGLLLLGDIHLDWAEEDPRQYEEARRAYAGLIERYGQLDEYMERMLLYFIRTDVYKEIEPLATHYLAGRVAEEYKKIPLGAKALAELGGYLLDRGEMDFVRIALTAAAVKDPSLPETHYHFARYFKKAGSKDEERKALDNAIKTFSSQIGLGAKRQAMYIDSLVWRGRYRLAAGEWLSAEQDYAAAASEYERGLDLRRLKRGPRFAEAYAGLGEVAYWQRDDREEALRLFERAAADGYDTPDTRYKRAYIHYRAGRTAESLPLFLKAGLDGKESPYLTYAFGDALYARGDFFAAEGSFRRVVESMQRELEQIDMPSPQERPSQGEIVDLLMKAQNNYGAAIYKAAARVGDARRRAAAMAAFAESGRLFDSLSRDQETMVRSEAKNLAFLNTDLILHPTRGMDVAIYTEIERDMRFPKLQKR